MLCDKCDNSPAELFCKDCNLHFCQGCKEHSHTKEKLHKHVFQSLVAEPCGMCEDTTSTCCCLACGVLFCTECFEKVHKLGNLRQHQKTSLPAVTSLQNEPSIRGEQKWEDTRFGWFPNPRTERCVYSNKLLPDYYQSVWRYKSDVASFRKSFNKELSRQWTAECALRKVEKSFTYVCSKNEASIGHLLQGCKIKPGCNVLLKTNIARVEECLVTVKEIISDITENQIVIHDDSGRVLKKPHKQAMAQFNLDILDRSRALEQNMMEVSTKCEQLLDQHRKMYPTKQRMGRTEAGYKRKKVHHNKRKSKKRSLHRTLHHMKSVSDTIVFQCSCGTDGIIDTKVQPNQVKSNDLTRNINVTNLRMDMVVLEKVRTLKTHDMKALMILIEAGLFSHEAKCAICDNLPPTLEEVYWVEYEKFYDGDNNVSDSSGFSGTGGASDEDGVDYSGNGKDMVSLNEPDRE